MNDTPVSLRALPLRLLPLLVCLLHLQHLQYAVAQQIPVWPNSSFSGTTVRATTGIVKGFSMYDHSKEVGLGGQVILHLDLTASASVFTDLVISSCESSSFETYLAMLDANPFKNPNASIIAESANDINCNAADDRAYLTTRLVPAEYFVVVTGLDKQEGRYNISIVATPANATALPWGLDRVDQRALPLDARYVVPDIGDDIWVYLIDSGVRASHELLRGRVEEGHDFINNRIDSAPDCTGHGTHVAGIIAGAATGVAKQTRIIAVRVFGCNNKARTADIVDAVHWVMLNSKERSIRRRCIVALMFATPADAVRALRPLQSVMRSLRKSGIPVLVPSGNTGSDSCASFPSSLDSFVSVAATDREDFRAPFSNYGNCTDVYAPGADVESSWHTSDTARRRVSGTGQAAAYMTGIVAVLSAVNLGITGERVKSVLESISTQNVVDNIPGNRDDSRFAFVRAVPDVPMPEPEKGEVHIFAIIELQFNICNESAQLAAMRTVFADVVSIEPDAVHVNCTAETTEVTLLVDPGALAVKQDEFEGPAVPLMLRFKVYERDATMAFRTLEEALGVGRSAVQSRLGYPFVVLEKPWAFASDRFIYWGVPTFFDATSRRLSAGQIAGVVVGCLFALCLVAIVLWVCYRKAFTLDRVDSMEGSADEDAGPVLFEQPANTPASPSRLRSLVRVMSFRNAGLARMGSQAGGGGGGGAPGAADGPWGGADGGAGPDLLRSASEADRPASAPRDILRLSSFGGEAFAQMARTDSMMEPSPRSMTALTKEMSMQRARNQGEQLSTRMDSQAGFGGPGDSGGDAAGAAGATAVRLESVGGEAFLTVSDYGESDRSTDERV